MLRSHRRLASGLVSAAVLALGLSACGGDGGSGSDGTVTLTVDTFSTFGYEELFKQYEADHPGIKIKHRNVVQLDEYLPRLEQWIAAGSGAADVVASRRGSSPSSWPTPTSSRTCSTTGLLAEGQLPGLEVEAGAQLRREVPGRPRHRHRRPRHVLPHRPVQEGLPDRPRRGRQALADLGRVHRHRQEVRREGEGLQVRRRLGEPLQHDPRPGGEPERRLHVLRHVRQARRTATPPSRARGTPPEDPAGRAVGRAEVVRAQLGLRLQAGEVRDGRVPVLDAGRHQGEQPARTRPASGTSRRSRAAPAAAAARSSRCPSRASTPSRPPSWPNT